jgi:hypothetical protein
MFERIQPTWIILVLSALLLGLIAYFWMKPVMSVDQSIQIRSDGYRLSFTSQHQSTLDGVALVRPDTKTIEIEIRLRNLTPGSSYNLHLHEGTCRQGGGGGLQLNSVTPNADTGISTTRVDLDRLNPTMDHLIMVHRPDGHHVLCADMPSIPRLKSFDREDT